jgi:hypothetical protein
MSPDERRTHHDQSIHHLSCPSFGGVACVEWGVKWFSLGRNHILIQSKPVNVRAFRSPWLSHELKGSSFSIYIGVSGIERQVGLEIRGSDLLR